MTRTYYVYILTNKNNTVLYTGVTNNLERRMAEHRSVENHGFTARYKIHKLV
jgi:putative endonuclease